MKRRKKNKKAGLPPGSIVFTGDRKVETIQIHYLKYDSNNLEEKILDNHYETIFSESFEDQVDWYDIRGLHDTRLIEQLGSTFKIHPLVLEDIVNTNQRPKYEEYNYGDFITIRALSFNKTSRKLTSEHISLFFRKGLIITFQETESDLFTMVRSRLISGKGKVRDRGADYLAYAILDVLIDNYFIVLDKIEEVIEEIEDGLITDRDLKSKSEIHHLKKELIVLRKSISPLREAIARFSKSDSPNIEERNQLYIRDLYEHTIQIMDMVETYRDILIGLQDLLITEVSFRMNQVMQVLTLVSTIFIPLTFLAGIYGMNFDNMPELHWKYGYYVLLGIMAVILAGLIYLFRRKRWI